MLEVPGSNPGEDTPTFRNERYPRRSQVQFLAKILKVIVPVMEGPTAHLMSAAVWTPVRSTSYTNTEPVLGNWYVRISIQVCCIRNVHSSKKLVH